jgi:hypothetical protein
MNVDLAGRNLRIVEPEDQRIIYYQGRILSGDWHRDEATFSRDRTLMWIPHKVTLSLVVLISEIDIIRSMIAPRDAVTRKLQIHDNGFFLLNRVAMLMYSSIEPPMLRDGSIVCDMTWAFTRQHNTHHEPPKLLEKVDWKRVGF